MKSRHSKSWNLLSTLLTVLVILSAALGMGIPVGADPGPTRSVEPASVSPGELVNVTIEFLVVPCDFTFLAIHDYVPLGWNASDLRVNEDASETLLYAEFNSTTGSVLFLWIPIGSGVPVKADYTLHVPMDAETGMYNVTGKLFGWREDIGSWNTTIPNGTIVVEPPYAVDLRVDEEEKTTDPNVDVTYYLTVENLGPVADTYVLSKLTEADFARLNKTTVSLGPGESEVVALTVASGFLGIYNTTVRATGAHASDEVTVTTIVRELEDTEPPAVTAPIAEPYAIPEDTDNEPLWGENSTLNVTVTDDSEIMSVTIDLSAIGGSAVQPMTNTGGNTWSVTTNASNGTAGWNGTAYVPYYLQVNATDEYSQSNTSVSIPLTVVQNGDVSGNGVVTLYDATYIAKWYLGKEGFETISEGVADVSGSGVVTLYDATYIAKWYLGKEGFEILR